MNNNTDHSAKDLQSSERFAYLLHIWRENGQWRASLKELETGRRLGFANLELLFAYLMDRTERNLTKERTDEAEPR
jgi:hypothetical protein